MGASLPVLVSSSRGPQRFGFSSEQCGSRQYGKTVSPAQSRPLAAGQTASQILFYSSAQPNRGFKNKVLCSCTTAAPSRADGGDAFSWRERIQTCVLIPELSASVRFPWKNNRALCLRGLNSRADTRQLLLRTVVGTGVTAMILMTIFPQNSGELFKFYF